MNMESSPVPDWYDLVSLFKRQLDIENHIHPNWFSEREGGCHETNDFTTTRSKRL